MTVNLQIRIAKWQASAIDGVIKKNPNLKRTDVARFALNYILVNYKGAINADTMDQMEFKARTIVS